jgi:hypothetical protein
VSGREARSLIEIGQILERRNERLTEWMRWQAFSGQLTIEYQQRDTALVIDYPLPSGHRPTVLMEWRTPRSRIPMSTIFAPGRRRSRLRAGSLGSGSTSRAMTSRTFSTTQKLRDYFNVAPGQPFLPTLDDVLRLLRPGTQIITFDTAYRDESVGASQGVPRTTRGSCPTVRSS